MSTPFSFPLKILCGMALPLLLLLLWHLNAAEAGEFGLPHMSAILTLLWNISTEPQTQDLPPLLFSLQVSLLRTITGFAIAVFVGVPAGLLLGRVRVFRWLLSPLLNILYVISPLAWLPLLIWMIGFDSLSTILHGETNSWRYPLSDNLLPAMLLIIFTAAVFPIMLTTERASESVREDLLQTARLYGASWIQQMRLIVLPHSLPEIVSGIRLGLGRAWMVIIAAEMYPSTRSGLGYTIWQSQSTMRFDYAVAAIILIGIFGVIMNGGLHLLQKRINFWQRNHS